MYDSFVSVLRVRYEKQDASHATTAASVDSFAHLIPLISWERFKNEYELLNLRALKISMLCKKHIFQCIGKIFCVEFQRVPLQFHAKYFTHTLKDVDLFHRWKFKSS